MPAPVFSSPQTSGAAIAIIILTVGYVVFEFLNGNIGNVDWTLVAAGITGAIGFFSARDNNRSSEDVGIK